MFDLRYHVASLAAVFIALAVGVVIGVAIASGGEVDEATRSLDRSRIDRLEQQLDAANERVERAQDAGRAERELIERAYPALMDGRLDGKRIAVLFVGPLDDGVNQDVERTLEDAGTATSGLTVLTLPIDSAAIDAALDGSLAGDSTVSQFMGESNLRRLGHALGAELVTGGEAPLWDALATTLVEQRGEASGSLDGVVLAQTWLPDETDAADTTEQTAAAQTEDLVGGILDGLQASGAAIVGVAASDSSDADARLALFKDAGISTVNDVEELPGHVALAVLLAGGEPGDYGTGEGATGGVSPPIEPLVAATVAE